MKIKFQHYLKSHFFAVVIILFGVVLRFVGYAQFPVLGETKDEYAWTFLGSSLLETGSPASWSHFSAYTPFTTLTIGFDKFLMVRPALDHPPLFSLIPGFMHTISSENWLAVPSVKVMRFPMIFIGGINILLVYLISIKFFEHKNFALLATLLYAIIPSVVFSSRLVVAENLLVTWVLLSILLIFYETKKRVSFFSIIVISILSVLTKFSGITIPFSFILYGLIQHDRSKLIAGVMGGIIGILIFSIYGWWFDWQIFINVFFSQSGRDIGLATLINRFFLHPTIVNHIFLDGAIFVGLLSLPSLFMSQSIPKRSQNIFQFIKISLLIQLAFIASAVGETTIHGWYAYTIFPFLVWAAVQTLTNKSSRAWVIPFLWLFMLPTIRTALLFSTSLPSPLIARIIIGFGFLPLIFSTNFFKYKTLENASVLFILSLVIVANVLTIVKISDVKYWEDDEYFLPSRVVK